MEGKNKKNFQSKFCTAGNQKPDFSIRIGLLDRMKIERREKYAFPF